MQNKFDISDAKQKGNVYSNLPHTSNMSTMKMVKL